MTEQTQGSTHREQIRERIAKEIREWGSDDEVCADRIAALIEAGTPAPVSREREPDAWVPVVERDGQRFARWDYAGVWKGEVDTLVEDNKYTRALIGAKVEPVYIGTPSGAAPRSDEQDVGKQFLLTELSRLRETNERLLGRIVLAAEALVESDANEAYHQLYAAVDPHFQKTHSPFDDVEKYAVNLRDVVDPGNDRNDLAHVLAGAPRSVERAGEDSPWPVPQLLRVLSDAADHLLRDHDCDQHGWEHVGTAVTHARSILQAWGVNAAKRRQAIDAAMSGIDAAPVGEP